MSKIITILGKKGYGKTTYMASLFNEFKTCPCLIFDLFNQYKIQLTFFDILIFMEYIKEYGLKRKFYKFAVYEKLDFDIICRFITNQKNINLFVDEIDMFDSPISSIDSFRKLIHYSRHYNVNIITTSRRPQRISRDLTSQTDEYIFFKITENRDLEYIKQISEYLAEKVRRLKKFEFIRYSYQDDQEIKSEMLSI